MPQATLFEAVSDTAWSNFTAADYDIGQWRRACLIDTGDGDADSKARYKLPVREPSGTVNRNGCHAAASVLGGGRGGVQASAAQKKAAAKKLVGLYRNQLSEDPPDSLLTAAGMAATESADRVTLFERADAPAVVEADSGGGEMLIQLISPGWGSSGYYGSDVLEAAASDRVFPAGTHMYLDHPTITEDDERPERSVKDLAAVLTEDASWDGSALVANAKVFNPWRDPLAEMADVIGVSIRATAAVSQGEAEGRRGLIVERLNKGISVDFVTRAGRGGQILQVLESAREHAVVASAVGHGVAEATANDTRAMLDQALHDTYGGEKTWVYVRDFDADTVWYCYTTPDTEATYQLGYSLDDNGMVAFSGDPIEVRTETRYVPVTPAGQQSESTQPGSPAGDERHDMEPKNKSAGANDPTGGGTQPALPGVAESQVSEAQVTDLRRQLDEANRQIALIGENAQRATAAERARDEAVAEARRLRAEREAERRTTVKLGESQLPEAAWPKVVAAVSASVPMNEAGDAVDDDKLDTAITAAIEAEKAYIAALLESQGVGTPRGLGATGDQELSEADFQTGLGDIFAGLGMDENTAKLAAKGR